jgi:regulator of cell morphogenesis and NO signaling
MSTTDAPHLDLDRSLGDLVAELPARARVLERAGLDYCCKGGRSLRSAATDAGLDPATVAAELAAVQDRDGSEVDALGPVELADHIVAVHHAYLHEELPLLEALSAKVLGAHGSRHPELADVARLVIELREDLGPHLAREEQVLFPAIRALGDAPSQDVARSVTETVRVLLGEHDRAGELLAELRARTGDYSVPADGCASYRSLYERLADLEADTHRHIHLENNVLFPAVVALAA